MTELYQLTIHQAGKLLREHKISSVELTRAHLDRIRAVDDKLKHSLSLPRISHFNKPGKLISV